MDTTLKIALYGVFVSTVSLLIHYFNYRRDKANIIITVKGNMKVHPLNTFYGDKTYINVTVANRGRKPVTITHCAIRVPMKSYTELLLGDSFRKQGELLEGKSQSYMLAEDEIKKINLADKDLVAYVIDATGRYYWADNFIMRWIKIKRCRSKIPKREGGYE